MNTLDIIIKPVFTEKSTKDIANRKYHFWVKPKSTKEQIKKAVEVLYDVQVSEVNTSVYNNRTEKKRGYKTYKIGTNYKKAIVELKDGESIESLSQNK